MAAYRADNRAIDVETEDAAFAAGWGFPSDWYTSRSIFDLERIAIIGRSWHYLSPRSGLARPGDVVVSQLGDVAVILVLDEAASLRGFVNACRHRGFPVIRENCNTKSLVCGYHAWSYRLNGSLRAAPGSSEESAFDSLELALIPIAVDCWGEMIFGNLCADAAAFTAAHPEIDSYAGDHGIDKAFERYRFERRVLYEVGANWKLFYDNDVECYHCPTIHPKSFNEAYVTQTGEFTRYESASGQLMGHRFRPRTDARDTPGAIRSENYRSLRAFPGFTVAQQDDVALITQIVPTEVERMRYVADFYSEVGADPGRVERWIALWDQTFREDAEVCELQQRSVRTGILPRNRVMASREPGVKWARDNIWKLLRHSLTADAGGAGARAE